jgi:hypothetical protein
VPIVSGKEAAVSDAQNGQHPHSVCAHPSYGRSRLYQLRVYFDGRPGAVTGLVRMDGCNLFELDDCQQAKASFVLIGPTKFS